MIGTAVAVLEIAWIVFVWLMDWTLASHHFRAISVPASIALAGIVFARMGRNIANAAASALKSEQRKKNVQSRIDELQREAEKKT